MANETKPKIQVNPVEEKAADPNINPTQKIETANYMPTYKIRPEFKKVVVKAIGHRPFNEIAGLMNAVDVEVMDHQTLNQVVQALGQFPYVNVADVIKNINQYITQVIED